ncbi:hypothetical protein BJ978_002192 [Agromyces terreus]|uniref:UDP-glucose 4-epimerase n=2 Tax=Agromyces terreus TaxID=424795 RepID=A0A9X2KCM4_9MICO|nr:DUF779 domain-containing protein [Agromyces terreus]MCP2371516.1 hypothetical protein [Agromyces terreus]
MSIDRTGVGALGRIVGSITVAGERMPRVELSPAASDLLAMLWGEHGPLMFHQSGGCCDGSSPMCYPAGDFITSDADVLLGELDLGPADAGRTDVSGHPGASSEADVAGSPRIVPFWMSAEQFAYWRHTYLTVDVVKGRGSGFSVEAPEGVRFLIRSRLIEE